MAENAIALRPDTSLAPAELSIEQMTHQVQKIQELMGKLMTKGEHYGVIPGTGSKPTLLKPGAEKLCLMFRLAPRYEVLTREEGDHLTVISTCALYHINTGAFWGTGMGSCSTKESKYAYRKTARTCPDCGKETLIHTKRNPEDWWCNKYKDGCGSNFNRDDARISEQLVGRAENPDKADQYNTVLKMANKRSLVAAVLNATAASDIFTQDLEDRGSGGSGGDGTPEPELDPLDQREAPDRLPTEKANSDEKQAVISHADQVMGKGKGKAWCDAWLVNRNDGTRKQGLDLPKVGKWGDVTVGHIVVMHEELDADIQL